MRSCDGKVRREAKKGWLETTLLIFASRLCEEIADGLPVFLLGFRYRLTGQDAVVSVNAITDAVVFEDCGFRSARETQNIGKGRIRECERRCIGHRGWHVGDAVVLDAVDFIGWVAVGGGFRRFDAAALVDGHVDDDCALLHPVDHLLRHDFGSGCTGDEHATDDEVGFPHSTFDVVGIRCESEELAVENVVKFAEAVEVEINDGGFGAHAYGNLCSIGTDDASANDADICGRYAGNATEQEAASAFFFFEIGCADAVRTFDQRLRTLE